MSEYTSPLARRLELLAVLQPAELEQLKRFESHPLRYERGREIFSEGEDSKAVYIIQHGWGCSFKLLPNGERQIVSIVLPGDCIDLRSALRQQTSYNFLAITDLIATRVDTARVVELYNEFPHLGVTLLLAHLQDDSLLVEHLISVGRRTAIERVAHLFLEFHDRLTVAGVVNGTRFHCPLTQDLLADTLGLSTIHVNRMLRELREQKLMTFSDYTVDLLDLPRLNELTGYVARQPQPIINRRDLAPAN